VSYSQDTQEETLKGFWHSWSEWVGHRSTSEAQSWAAGGSRWCFPGWRGWGWGALCLQTPSQAQGRSLSVCGS
jgi:hypothetical protein